MDRRNPSQRPTTTVARPTLRRMESLARVRRSPGDGAMYLEARADLAQWLVAGREARGLTREQVAQTTRIQLRTIERLEEGQFDDLPADVFVRGFIRGYARCVGLPVEEALSRYGSCGFAAAPVASPQAQALLESMSGLVPPVARTGPLARAPRILGDDAPAGEGEDIGVVFGIARLSASLSVPLAAGSLRDIPAIRGEAPAASVSIDDLLDAALVATTTGSPATTEAVAAAAPAVPPVADSVTDPVSGVTARAPEGAAPRRKKAAEASLGPAVRDARGRFVRRTGVMPAVDVVALGLEAEGQAVDDGASPTSQASTAQPSTAQPSTSQLTIDLGTDIQIDVSDGLAPLAVPAALAEAAADAPALAAAPEPVWPAPVTPPTPLAPDEVVVPSRGIGRTTGSTLAIPPRTSGVHVAPTLVIDDDDPEDAERAREARLAPRKDADKGWRSFLPPALLDQQKGRQGGLTLAVIILLIVATLTLSYLMRRPSSAGEGITARPAAAQLVS